MSITDELAGVAPIGHVEMKVLHEAPATASIPAEPLPPPTPDELRAVDATFVQDKESATLAGLLAFHTGSLLLVDLAHEHFDGPEEIGLPPEKKKKKEEEE